MPAPLITFAKAIVAQIVNPLILLLAAGAFVAFLWGVVQFIAHGGNEERRKEGRDAILWGLVGLVVIFGAYGFINLVLGTFNIPAIHKISS